MCRSLDPFEWPRNARRRWCSRDPPCSNEKQTTNRQSRWRWPISVQLAVSNGWTTTSNEDDVQWVLESNALRQDTDVNTRHVHSRGIETDTSYSTDESNRSMARTQRTAWSDGCHNPLAAKWQKLATEQWILDPATIDWRRRRRNTVSDFRFNLIRQLHASNMDLFRLVLPWLARRLVFHHLSKASASLRLAFKKPA